MKNKYDVVIIGAGIYGSSIFYHLLTTSNLKVLLVDQKHVASGATGVSGGFVRLYHRSLCSCDLAAQSIKFFQNFNQDNHHPCGFVPTGFITVEDKTHSDQIYKNIDFLKNQGHEIDIYSHKLLGSYLQNWFIPLNKEKFYIYEKNSGYANPVQTCQFFVAEGLKRGGHIAENSTIDHVIVTNNKVTGVLKDGEKLGATCVVLAIGVRSGKFLSEYTNQFSFYTKIIQFGYFQYACQDKPIGTFLDMTVGLFGKQIKKNTCIFGLTTDIDEKEFILNKDMYVDVLLNKVRSYLGSNRVTLEKNIFGKDSYSLENQGVAEFLRDIDGFFVCSGWSGVGFKISPQIGKLSASQIIEMVCN